MKTKLLALSLLMGAMSLPLAAQVKVSVSASKQPVETVLEQIKQSSGYEIFYNDDHVKNLKPVTIKANNEIGKQRVRSVRTRFKFRMKLNSNME